MISLLVRLLPDDLSLGEITAYDSLLVRLLPDDLSLSEVRLPSLRVE